MLLKKSIVTLLPILVLLSISCSESKKRLRFATGADGGSYKHVGALLANEIGNNSKYQIDCYSGENFGSNNNLAGLLNGKYDIALVQNDAKISRKDSTIPEIRTILPIYPEILFVIYNKELDVKHGGTLYELLKNRRICFGPLNSGTEDFILKFFKANGISTSLQLV